MTDANPTAPAADAKPPRKGARGKLFAILGGAVLVAALGWGAWWALVGSRQVATDNAYVAAETAQVTPQIGGPVKAVHVVDTQAVKAGEVLVELDDADARLAVAQAEAALAQSERRVRGLFANDDALSAQVSARSADETAAAARLAAAEAELGRARGDLQRRTGLVDSGAVSAEEMTAVTTAYANAEAQVRAARAAANQARAGKAAAEGQREANAVLTRGSTVETNPEVAAARARLDQARIDLARTVIRAPIDGLVARRQVQVGQRVAPGAPLMAVVPVQQAYVEANFKEVQLKDVRVGQEAELESDLYGHGVKFTGKVVGLAGGTGSAFALIPAQNATGNWIKVVQRVPVRIALDPQPLKEHPLRVGLSMKAVIKTKS